MLLASGQLTLTRGVFKLQLLFLILTGSSIQTYEAAGVSLVGINTVHTIPTNATLEDAIQTLIIIILKLIELRIDPLGRKELETPH